MVRNAIRSVIKPNPFDNIRGASPPYHAAITTATAVATGNSQNQVELVVHFDGHRTHVVFDAHPHPRVRVVTHRVGRVSPSQAYGSGRSKLTAPPKRCTNITAPHCQRMPSSIFLYVFRLVIRLVMCETENMLKEQTITATEFKAKCLSILERLDPRGLIVTKRGRAIAKVIPVNSGDNESLIGSMKGKIKIKGDIFTTGVTWNAESGHTYRRRTPRRESKKG